MTDEETLADEPQEEEAPEPSTMPQPEPGSEQPGQANEPIEDEDE